MSDLVLPSGWPSPAALISGRDQAWREAPSRWAARELVDRWGAVPFDVGFAADLARVSWVDGPTIGELSCSVRAFSRALRLELHRNPSLAAMVWFTRAARTEHGSGVRVARDLFAAATLQAGGLGGDWDRLERIGRVAAVRHPNGRPRWGDIAVVERLLEVAPDEVIDAATVLAGESEMGMADLIRTAHRL